MQILHKKREGRMSVLTELALLLLESSVLLRLARLFDTSRRIKS